MDLLLPCPCPLESEASLWNEAWLKLQGGRTRWRETQFLSGMATRCPRAARNHPLSLGLSFHTCKLLPLDCSPALFPIARAGRFRLQLRAWESLILSRITSAHTPNAVSEPYRIDPWFPLCPGLAFSPQSSPGSLVPLLLASSLQFVRFSEDEASAKLVTSLHWSKPAPPHLTRRKVTVPPCGPSSPISFMGSGHQTRP